MAEPMSAERLAELREAMDRCPSCPTCETALELIAEIERLRAEAAALRREPGPRVPNAPGWWWWRDRAELDWEACLVTTEPDGLAWQAVGMPEAEPLESSGGEWGGRCEEPRR